MTAEQWREVSRVFHEALARPADARQRFVAGASDDETVRLEVLSLLAQPSGETFAEGARLHLESTDGGRLSAVDDPQDVLVGRRFGRYQITSLLGAGGMGRVYRAHDATLGRDVAIKLLPDTFTSDPDRISRFEREARLLASLNHPRIATIFGIEDVEGRRGLVLELVEGETLAARLRRAPVPLGTAVGVAEQIAEALEAAHEKGIVHRDLKPANISIGANGAVKVLDFGLAKVAGPTAGGDSGLAPTEAAGLSIEGVIVGTPAYMSPEQARGEPVDKRTDVWAFGCVVYEMLTGSAAFGGRTPSDAIATVLQREPDFSRLPAETPPRLRRLLERCLAKDRDRRLRDIGDARLELIDSRGASDALPLPPARARIPASLRWGWVGGAAVAGGVVALAVATWLRPERSPLPFEEPGAPLTATTDLTRVTFDDGYVEAPALSPDGRLVAFASDRAGEDNLDIWLQHVAGGDPIRLTRSADEERQPSFSADGGQILFRSEAGRGGLYTVPTLGGVPRLVVEAGIGGRYSPDGRWIAYWTGPQIGFTNEARAYRTFVMPAGGGASRELEGFSGARFPVWSPDSRVVMVAGSRAAVPETETYDWWVVHPDTGEAVETGAVRAFRAAGAAGTIPAPSAWVRERIVATAGAQLWSAPLASAPRFAVARVQRVTFGPGEASQPAAGADGLLAFVGSTSSQNLWAMPLDGEAAVVNGAARQITEGAGPYGRGAYSASEALLAFQGYRGKWTIFIRDMASGRTADLSVPARQFGPVLSPDGTMVVFPQQDGGASVIAVEGGPLRRVCDDCEPGEWTPDGRAVAAAVQTKGIPGLMSIDVATGRRRPLLGGGETTNRPHFSRDGRWLAFRATDRATGSQVFVVPFDAATPVDPSTWVSISDARERDARPAGWSPGGRMIYFLSSRDGFRCLYARPWDAQAGRPGGPIQLVHHFHNFRNPGGGGASVISTGAGSAIASDHFIFDFSTVKGDVWMMRLPTPER